MEDPREDQSPMKKRLTEWEVKIDEDRLPVTMTLESLPSKTLKTATEKQDSARRDSDKPKASTKKDFEEFKRLMLDDPHKKLADLSYREVDELMRDQPHEMAEKFKAAHKRAVLQRKGNSKLRNELDEAVDNFSRKTGLDPEHFPYEEYLKNDSVRNMTVIMLLVIVLSCLAPFGLIYLGVHVGKGLKAMYPSKFAWLPL
jgi:hypothetical protein